MRPARVAIALLACTVHRDQPNLDGKQVEITFLHTSDWHSRLLPYDFVVGNTDKTLGLCRDSSNCAADAPFGGAARAATIIRRERERGGRVVHLDSGDSFQGAPIFNAFDGEVEFRALSAVGLDASVIGNHEFDRGGANFVDKARRFAEFPLLAANYQLASPNVPGSAQLADVTAPYTIVSADGLRIGVIGIGNTSSLTSLFQQGNSLGITPLEVTHLVQDYVDFIRPLCDLVVLVTHIGPNEDQYVVEHTEGIDLVFGGHLHIVLSPPKVAQDCAPDTTIDHERHCSSHRRNVPIVHSGAFLKYVGKLTVVVQQAAAHSQNWEVVSQHYETLPVRCEAQPSCEALVGPLGPNDSACTLPGGAAGVRVTRPGENCAIPEDPAMVRLLEPYAFSLHQMTNLTRVVGFTTAKIARFATSTGDSGLGDVVAEAMLSQQRVIADFSITNSLGIRADLDPGPITVEQLYNVFPFENTITLLLLSGVEVQEMFDFVANRSAGRGCNSQSQIAGTTFTMDCNFGTACRNRAHECRRRPGKHCATRDLLGGSNKPCETDAECDAETQEVCHDPTPHCSGASEQACWNDGDCPSGETCEGRPLCADQSVMGGSRNTCTDDSQCAAEEICLGPCTPCGLNVTIGGTGAACNSGHDPTTHACPPGRTCCTTPGEICTPKRHATEPDMRACGLPITPLAAYELAANDYIAHGGSGFEVLRRNTSQVNLGISLRDAVMDYLNLQPTCGSGIDPSVYDQLYQMARNLTDGTGPAGDVSALVQSISGHGDYKMCADPASGQSLTQFARRECRGLSPAARAGCEDLADVRSALVCFQLPCVHKSDDGRIQRIFLGTTEAGGDTQENQNIE